MKFPDSLRQGLENDGWTVTEEFGGDVLAVRFTKGGWVTALYNDSREPKPWDDLMLMIKPRMAFVESKIAGTAV